MMVYINIYESFKNCGFLEFNRTCQSLGQYCPFDNDEAGRRFL